MRVKIVGWKPFKVTGKTDPSKVYEGINLFAVSPLDPKYGSGHQTVDFTVWADQSLNLLPNGADALLGKECDVYQNKRGVEAIIPVKA